MRQILNYAELFDKPVASNILFTTKQVHEANPVASRALIAALQEADPYINNNKAEVARQYLKTSGDPITEEEVLSVLNGKGTVFSTDPSGALPVWQYMHKAGMISTAPADWREMFFEDIQKDIAG
ncbi:hypothetical protein [Brucella endophytica]|uniref:hypothetical protein n=1 Tax=Brucella endophytica TaxID=1963359 RepID=UPI00166CDC60|nr:hypothetical protein [Brucella endophytica]